MESTKAPINCLEDEQKVIVKFLTLTEDIRPQKIRSRLAFVYKENAVSFETVLKWSKQFRGSKNVKRVRKKKENPFLSLHNCEKPWRRIEVPVGSEEKTAEIVPRKLFGILNKLTEKNFGILMKQVEFLSIDTEDCLRKVVKVIISYVCCEHKYSNLYAKLCGHISSKSVPFEKQIIGACPMYLGFGEVLRSYCEEDLKLKLKEIESVPFKSSDQLRYKLKGLNLFMAELYMSQVLAVECLHDEYLQLLFDDTDNIYKLENLCISLTQLGKFLEVQSEKTPPKFPKEHLDTYFTKIKSLLENKSKLTPRIYFMMLDLMELRNRNWIPRLEKKIKVRFVRKFRYRKFNQNANNTNNKNVNVNNKKKKSFKHYPKGESRSEKKEITSGDENKTEKKPYPNIIKGKVQNEQLEVQFKVRSAMNKMTDSNYICLLEQLVTLPFEQYSSEIVTLIVDKSIKEPLYCHLYAELCRHFCLKKLSNENTSQDGEKSTKNSFKELLLNECTKKWEEKIKQGLIVEDIQEELSFKYKTMSKGLAKFVAELYKLGILSNDTINNYIKTLLLDEKNKTLKNIEFACYFLTYIGMELEKENKEIFEKSFATIKLLYEKEPRYPYRIWFMLLDLLELKNNKWLSKQSLLDDSGSEPMGETLIKIRQARSPRGKRIRGKNKQQTVDNQKPAKVNNRMGKQKSSKITNSNANANQNVRQSCDDAVISGLAVTISQVNI